MTKNCKISRLKCNMFPQFFFFLYELFLTTWIRIHPTKTMRIHTNPDPQHTRKYMVPQDLPENAIKSCPIKHSVNFRRFSYPGIVGNAINDHAHLWIWISLRKTSSSNVDFQYMECARLIVLRFCRKQNIANKHCNNAEIKAYTVKFTLTTNSFKSRYYTES